MNYTVNLIGIGEAGKKILDEIKEDDNKVLLEKSYDTLIDNKVISFTYNINKIYYNREIAINEKPRYNLIIYDNKDRLIVEKLVSEIGDVEYLNIGISINGNDDISNLKVIEINTEDINQSILNLLQLVLERPSMISYDQNDIYDFFNRYAKFKIMNIDGINGYDSNDIIKRIGKYKNNKIEIMFIMSYVDTYNSLFYLYELFTPIWELDNFETSYGKWHFTFPSLINTNYLTMLIGIK